MPRTIEHLSPAEFSASVEKLVEILAAAMLASPILQAEISQESTVNRVREEMRWSLKAVVAKEDEELVGATLYFDAAHSRGKFQKVEHNILPFLGGDIRRYLNQLSEQHNIPNQAFLARTFVNPEHQNQGIANEIRRAVLEELLQEYPEGVIVFTNHLSINEAIIRSSEKLGFERTHIGHRPVGAAEDVRDEYWVLVLKPKKDSE